MNRRNATNFFRWLHILIGVFAVGPAVVFAVRYREIGFGSKALGIALFGIGCWALVIGVGGRTPRYWVWLRSVTNETRLSGYVLATIDGTLWREEPRSVNIATGISLAFCVLIAPFWVASYFGDLMFHKAGEVAFCSSEGSLVYTNLHNSEMAFLFGSSSWWRPARAFGINYQFGIDTGMMHIIFGGSQTSIPYWLLFVGAAAAPAVWLKRWIKARMKIPPGCCPVCRYDLRASPERCPECGTAVNGTKAAAVDRIVSKARP